MDELINDLLLKIDNSFLLSLQEKEEFKRFIFKNQQNYQLDKIILKFREEKRYINSYLKSILLNENKDLNYLEIHNNMRINYMKYIKEKEENEVENLEDIFVNFA